MFKSKLRRALTTERQTTMDSRRLDRETTAQRQAGQPAIYAKNYPQQSVAVTGMKRLPWRSGKTGAPIQSGLRVRKAERPGTPWNALDGGRAGLSLEPLRPVPQGIGNVAMYGYLQIYPC